MPEAKCIAPTTMPNAAAVNFALRVFGVRPKIQAIMHGNLSGSLITAQRASGKRTPQSKNLGRRVMMEFEFILKFTLTADSASVDELVERLGAAGCNDALVGIGQSGRIALDFTRGADSAKQAVFSALADVKRAIPAAKFLEITPDFVGLTDVAELVGVTRQNMRKLALTHKDSFPAAVHEGSATLWHLFPVLKWLRESADYSIKQSLLDVAHIAMQINLTKEASQIERQDQRELNELVA